MRDFGMPSDSELRQIIPRGTLIPLPPIGRTLYVPRNPPLEGGSTISRSEISGRGPATGPHLRFTLGAMVASCGAGILLGIFVFAITHGLVAAP